ncbi:MAG: hypothetical protein ACKVP7_01410 [Hyphomicrobiaceae bacterium]
MANNRYIAKAGSALHPNAPQVSMAELAMAIARAMLALFYL